MLTPAMHYISGDQARNQEAKPPANVFATPG